MSNRLSALLALIALIVVLSANSISRSRPAEAATQTFDFTGVEKTFTVPPGVTLVTIIARGAQGGPAACSVAGGAGAAITANFVVTPGQTLFVEVGGMGSGTTAGFNGGGAGGAGGAGPAFSGGGGGCGQNSTGGTGGVFQANGSNGNGGLGGGGGGGATVAAGGLGGIGNGNGAAGVSAIGGAGAGSGVNSPSAGAGGGGGGGFFGGGGGGAAPQDTDGSGGGGGGGGSDFFAAGATNTASLGTQLGNGQVQIITQSPLTIAKAFSPASIQVGGTSTLTITLTNPAGNTALTGVGFTDTLPTSTSAMTISGAATNTCGGTLTATTGTGSISLTGATLAIGASCTISMPVVTGGAGTFVNTTGAVTSNESGTGNTATATLVVAAPNATPTPTAISVILPGITPSPVIPVFQNPAAGGLFNPIAKTPTPRAVVLAVDPNAVPAGQGVAGVTLRPPNTGDAGLQRRWLTSW